MKKMVSHAKVQREQPVVENQAVGGVSVSVLMPVYNAEKHIQECLDSILRQTLRNIEIIAIDDGSTDGSREILDRYAARDVRVKCFSQKNSGASVARNRALTCAAGEFVCFVDPDDLLPNQESLSILYAAAKRHSVLASCGSLERFDPLHPELGVSCPKNWQFPDSEVRNWRDNPFEFCYQLFIFNRRMLVDGNIRFPEVTRYQDPPFMVRAMAAAKRYHTSSVISYRYRLGHQKINWQANDYRKLRDMFVAMRDVIEFANNDNLPKLVKNTIARITIDYRDVLLAVPGFENFAEWQSLVSAVPAQLRHRLDVKTVL